MKKVKKNCVNKIQLLAYRNNVYDISAYITP